MHETLWLSCATKRCCSTRVVLPAGRDIWRIATRLEAPPESFLRPVPAQPDCDDGFLLAPRGPPMHAALARTVSKGRAAACVFLLHLGDRATRCGLDALRPLPCQSFPATGSGEIIRVDGAPCDCRAWTLADLDRGHVLALLRQETHERQHYRGVIRAWNTRVGAAPSDARFAFGDFCRYVIDTYASDAQEREPRGQL